MVTFKCNNCNSEHVSKPFEVQISDLENDYHEFGFLIKCFDCGFVGESSEFVVEAKDESTK